MAKLRQVKFVRYRNALENNQGWCKNCNKFTGEDIEPDAEGEDCEECGEDSVVGAETALTLELFEIVEEDLADDDDDDQQEKKDDNA
jgi:hypothetical protein